MPAWGPLSELELEPRAVIYMANTKNPNRELTNKGVEMLIDNLVKPKRDPRGDLVHSFHLKIRWTLSCTP
jgi:hypothetical protein